MNTYNIGFMENLQKYSYKRSLADILNKSLNLNLGGAGEVLPIYDIERMCVPSSPFFSSAARYTIRPFFSNKMCITDPFFMIGIRMVPFSYIRV